MLLLEESTKVPQKVDSCFKVKVIKHSFARTVTEPVLLGVHKELTEETPRGVSSCSNGISIAPDFCVSGGVANIL